MGDAIVPITSLRLPGRRTGETDPRDGKGFDARRTGPAYPATVGAGGRRDGTVTAPPSQRDGSPLPCNFTCSLNFCTQGDGIAVRVSILPQGNRRSLVRSLSQVDHQDLGFWSF